MTVHPLWRPFPSDANAARQSQRLAHRQEEPGLIGVRPGWDLAYSVVRESVLRAVDGDVLQIQHVGSTAVPGLLAKPILDVDLTVPNVQAEERYVPALEGVGFRLIFRDDLGGSPHRQLTRGSPNTNLHVWSPESVEPQRHALFVRWMRTHEQDRQRYAAIKQAAVTAHPAARYNDSKAAFIYDIYEQIFLSDRTTPHDPRPREPSR